MTNKFDSSKVFFTSDVHFDHNNIIRFCDRPYNNLHELNEELRHDDHKWEFGKEEFKSWISDILEEAEISYVEIGDSVDGLSTTQGVIVKRIWNNREENR